MDPLDDPGDEPTGLAWCPECQDGEVYADGLCELCWDEQQAEWAKESRETERGYWQSR